MAKVYGIPGEWARVKGTVTGLWPLFLDVFLLGFAAALALFCSFVCGAAVLLVALAVGYWTLHKGLRHVERFFIGAKGEEKVSEILRRLPDDYHVFNDFVAEGSHVDHVVVGPAGVYAVETKFWRGEVTVEDGHILLDGQLPDRSPLLQVRREAKDVKASLARQDFACDVTPVVAFASDTFREHSAEIDGTVVINSCELIKSFSEARRVVFPPADLERLVHLMENRK